MEPTKESPKVSQTAEKLPAQTQPTHANFLSRIWSVVKGVISYIGHLFAALLHLNTTKKAEDIKAEHPVQGKPAATSDKVDDKAKNVPPLNSGTPKTETAPKLDAAPPSPPIPQTHQKVDDTAKNVSPLDSGTPKTETPPVGAPPSPPTPETPLQEVTRPLLDVEKFARMNDEKSRKDFNKYISLLKATNLDELTACAVLGLRLTQDRKLYEARIQFIASIKDNEDQKLTSPERHDLFPSKYDKEMSGYNLYRDQMKTFCVSLRKNIENGEPPRMTYDDLFNFSHGICSRYPLLIEEEKQLLEQLKNEEWFQDRLLSPPRQFIQWLVSALIEEASISLPKTIEEEWTSFHDFEERMKKYRAEIEDMRSALDYEDPHRSRLMGHPFTPYQENKRIITWMRDYHRFDEACPKDGIPIDCPNDQNLGLSYDGDYYVYLLPHQLIWKPVEGNFYVKISYIDHETKKLREREEIISDVYNFIGFPYLWFGNENIDEKEYRVIQIKEPLYFDCHGFHVYYDTAEIVEMALSREVLDKMLLELHDKKQPQ